MASLAVVARNRLNNLEYLVRIATPAEWAISAEGAQRFQNLREATRAAMRLPSNVRAFALPAAP